jgi:hypothetical protein
MCLGMNPDILQPGERCASTSIRKLRRPPGQGGRTHLVSPALAAAAALAGHFVDPFAASEAREAVPPRHRRARRARPADVDTDQYHS